jgi:hypothetical protein
MQKHLGQTPPRVKVDIGGMGNFQRDLAETSSTAVGRAPIPGAVYGGISDGNILWAMPPQIATSPEGSSDTTSLGMSPSPMAPNPGSGIPNAGQDELMPDIDWEVFDKLFPPQQENMGYFDLTNPGVF